MQQYASVNQSWSCGLSIGEYYTLLEKGGMSRTAVQALQDGLSSLDGEDVAILAPGLMKDLVQSALPGIPAYGTKDCSVQHDKYVVCSSPFIYHEIHCAAEKLGISHEQLVYPFAPDVLADTLEAKQAIDLASWNALAAKYAHLHTHGNALTKYFDLNVYLGVAFKYAWDAGLHLSKPQTILDLGTGGSFFPFVCSYYGHKGYGLDRSREHIPEFFVEMADLLGVRVFYADIDTPFAGLDTFGFALDTNSAQDIRAPKHVDRKKERLFFDCVTAFAIGFSEGWVSRDYQHFFNVLRTSSGAEGIRFYSQPNPSGMMANEVLPALLNVGGDILEFRARRGFLSTLDIFLEK